jgi:beta-phosphoglucomutase
MEKTKDVAQYIEYNITLDTVLFFDMDGTLIDTNLANFLSYNKAIISVTKTDHELTYDPDRRFNRSNLKSAFPNLTENLYEKIIQEKEDNYNEFLNETKLNSKIADILFKYFNTNKTILVTNCRKDRVLSTLKHFGLDDKFSEIFYREFDNNNNRINKFKNAISKLGISPNLVIAFENEEIEIQDAKIAGIKNIVKI